MPFFAEIDLGTEDLGRLVDENTTYDSSAQRSGFIWPVLYSLQSPARERHFHARLSEHRFQVPIATATVAHATAAGLSPADPSGASTTVPAPPTGTTNPDDGSRSSTSPPPSPDVPPPPTRENPHDPTPEPPAPTAQVALAAVAAARP